MQRERPRHPSAWRADEIGGKEGVIHRMATAHVEALDRMLAATRDTPTLDLTRDSFRDAGIEALMAATADNIRGGRGAIILSGLDIAGYTLAEYERVYWYLGTFLGRAAIQSGQGDRLGHVRHLTDSKARGYTSDMELGPHTDYHEILSLACFRTASRGGLSGLSSAVTVHDALAATRPDLLEALYEGYYNGLPYRYGVNEDVSDRKVPVFCEVDGQVSAFTLSFFRDAAARRGEPLPPKLVEAFAVMRTIAESVQARFMLEPGEMMFWNNRVNFHSRTRFENDAGVERLLLRLWITPDYARPMDPAMTECAEMIERYHLLGLDQRELAVA